MIAVLACGLVVAVAFYMWPARPPAQTGPVALTPDAVIAPAHEARIPHLTGAEVRRDALILREGRRYRKDDSVPFAGVMTEFYGDGALQSRSVISNGLLDGLSEGWHTNGVKQVEELFRRGVSHGLRVKWHENGQKLSEAPIIDGKLEGVFKRWHDNGTLSEEISLRGGNPEGLSRSYYPSGCLKAEAHLSDGTVVDQKSWADGERR